MPPKLISTLHQNHVSLPKFIHFLVVLQSFSSFYYITFNFSFTLYNASFVLADNSSTPSFYSTLAISDIISTAIFSIILFALNYILDNSIQNREMLEKLYNKDINKK